MIAPKQFELRGDNAELFRCDDREVMLAGAAGTGKSVACLLKLLARAEKYPRSRHLFARLTRRSMTESGLVTWEDILPQGHESMRGKQTRKGRTSYNFANGSVVVVAGLDDGDRLFSTEWDTIYVQECLNVQEGVWEQLHRGLRHGHCPYHQLLGDTNPGPPKHWIKQREEKRTLRLLSSVHEDNPAYFDIANGRWTEAGSRYLIQLDQLSGFRHQRLRKGMWVSAEGVVWSNWDAERNLIDREQFKAMHGTETIPPDWRRFLVIDWGWNDPFVCQWWAQDPKRLAVYLYREIYWAERLVEDHAKEIARHCGILVESGANWRPDWTKTPVRRPTAIICDHDKEDRATVEKHLRTSTVAALKDAGINDGIQAVQAMLRSADDGLPRMFVLADALVERCPILAATKRPTCMVDEMGVYSYMRTKDGLARDIAEDANNHSGDCARYLAKYLETEPRLETMVSTQDRRLTVDKSDLFRKR